MIRHFTIIICLLFCSYFSLLGQSQDTLSSTILRHLISYPNTESSLFLADLEVDKKYQLYLIDKQQAGKGIPKIYNDISVFRLVDGDEYFQTYQFSPTSSIINIKLDQIESNVIYQLTIYCLDCLPKSAPRSMQGIQISENSDEIYLVEEEFVGGSCFDVDNISKEGNNKQFGVYTKGSFGSEPSAGAFGSSAVVHGQEGIILSTGNVKDGEGPNSGPDTGSGVGVSASRDADLEKLIGARTYDVVALEFDFTPTIDQVTFEYVFASDEYCEYVGEKFNDVFGFFLSGPGIDGEFSNNAINIARIPGTNEYVSINSVNSTNTEDYYVKNAPPGGAIFNSNCSLKEWIGAKPVKNLIEYDGLTTLLTAVANVIPCETYHIKLVIGDVGDPVFDSAVMLKANSFNAGGNATASINIPGIVDPTSTIAFEGCQEATIVFERAENDMSEPLTVTYQVADSSTAKVGEDYLPFQNSVIIPEGQMSIEVPIITINDNTDEPAESIYLELDQPCSCSGKVVELLIDEPPPLNANIEDVSTCEGGIVFLTPELEGAIGELKFNWSNGFRSETIRQTIDQETAYMVTVTDGCQRSTPTEATVNVTIDQPTATLQGAQKICNGDRQGDIEVNLSSEGDWMLTFARDGVEQAPIEVTETPYLLQDSVAGTYKLVKAEGGGCEADVDGEAILQVSTLTIDPSPQNPTCFNTTNGNITTIINRELEGLQFEWNTGSTERNIFEIGVGVYSLKVVDELECAYSIDSIELIAPPAIIATIEAEEKIDCNNLMIPEPEIEIEGGTPGHVYNIFNAADELVPKEEIGAGNYTVKITDAIGCTIEESFIVQADTIKPNAMAGGKDNLSCKIASTNLSGVGSSEEAGKYTYLWSTGNDGSIISGETTLTPIIDAPGTYQLVVTNEENSCESKASVVVRANYDKPEISVEDPSLLNCQVKETALKGTILTPTSATAIEWKTADGNIRAGTNELTATIDTPGDYRFLVTNEDNGCKDSVTVNVQQDIAPPVVNINDPVLTCTEQNVTIKAEVADLAEDEIGLSWSFQNPLTTVTNRNTLEPVVNLPGEATLTVNDLSNFCVSTVTATVTIDTIAPPADAGASFIFTCDLTTADLEGFSNGDNEYRWTTEDGKIEGGVSTLTPSIGRAGTYELKVNSNTNGCTATASVAITEDPNRPEAVIAPPASLNCNNTTLPLNAAASSQGSIMEHRWMTDDGVIIDTDNPLRPIIGKEGTYTLEVTNTQSLCVGETDVLVALDTVAPVARISPSKDFDCHTTTMQLDGTGSSKGVDFLYAWNSMDGSIMADPTTLFPTIGDPGTYTLLITSTVNGCTKEQSLKVEENIPRSAQVDKADPPCPNETGSINIGKIEGGIGPYRYSINGGNSYQSNQSFDRIPAGNYAISIMDNNGCELQDQVNIVAPPEIELDIDSELAIELGDSTTIQTHTNIPANQIADIVWTPAIGLSCDDCMQPLAKPIKSQTYNVKVMDINGCEATATINFLVDTNPNIYLPSAFSPNNTDGINDRFTVFAKSSSVRLVKTLRIFDRWGNLVFERANFSPNDASLGWDGRFNGQTLGAQVFVYYAEVVMIDDRDLLIRGDVALVE